MRPSALALVLALAGLLAPPAGRTAEVPSPAPEKKPASDPTSDYAVKHIEGWEVLVSQRLLRKGERDLGDRTLRLLGDHLYRITGAVPPGALANLRRIRIWVELAEGHHPCMCYHPSADWLREHGMNPQKAGCVEVANARNFLSWTQQQPWMVLHELAHGYHDQVLGFDNAEVRACYQSAVDGKLYDSVLHHDGKKVRAYALTNEKEYFAECTEAYFGTNDFYPFVRPELKQHDPRMYDLLEKVWGVRPAERRESGGATP
jgi:hypothetical protein